MELIEQLIALCQGLPRFYVHTIRLTKAWVEQPCLILHVFMVVVRTLLPVVGMLQCPLHLCHSPTSLEVYTARTSIQLATCMITTSAKVTKSKCNIVIFILRHGLYPSNPAYHLVQL